MSFLTKLFDLRDGNPLESPTVPLASLANAPGWLLNWAGGAPTDSGEQVTPLTALASTTIVSCVKLISEGAGQLPLQIIERLDRGTRVAHSPPYFDLLGSEWNDEMTATVGMQVSLVHALLWGTAYIELERDNGNHVIALWPRKPWLVQPKRDKAGKLVYESHDTANNKPVIIDSADMVCIPGLSLDGYVGQNIISTCRQAVGLAIGLERYAARYFGNGGSTSGVVEVPGELSDTAYQRLKTSTDLQMTGANRFRLLFLEGGAKFNTMAATNNEAQMIEARRLVRSELCSMLRCPIHMIASDESKGVKSNTEQISQEFMTFTLNPWLTKYTQAFNSRLFPKAGRTAGKYEVRFHTKALLAADSAARMTYYVQGRNAGILTSNECRIDEGLEPVGPEGDLLMVPLNTIPATQLLIEEGAAHDPIPAQIEEDEDQRSVPLVNRLRANYSALITDGLSRLSNRSKRDSTAISQCLEPCMQAISASLRDMLDLQYGVTVGDAETKRAVEKYLSGVSTRVASLDSPTEVTRVLKTLLHAAYRDLSEALANKALEEPTLEDLPSPE